MKHFRKLTGPYFAWLVLFVLIPLVLIAIYAFTTSGNPVKTLNFTLMNFAKINEPTYIKVFIKSIEMGVLTTGVCLILGYPMAYLIAKCPEEMQDMLIMAVTIPTWINMLLRTYAWMNLLSDNGIINGLLSVLGINPVTMMYTNFSVVVGMVCNFMPFMIIPIHTSLRKMDNSLIEAAMDLGASPVYAFFKVVFPDIVPGVLSGFLLAFTMSLDDFIITHFTKGAGINTLSTLIYSEVRRGIKPSMYALSTIIFLAVLVFLLITNFAPGRKKEEH